MPQKQMIITEVTAMSADNVCIVGYDSLASDCIRPVLPARQLKREFLFQNGKLVIYPGAKVSFNFIDHRPRQPHIEDYTFHEDSLRYEGPASLQEWEDILQETAVTSFSRLFPKLKDRCVQPGSPGPSLGTLSPLYIPSLTCEHYPNKPGEHSLRMFITDKNSRVEKRVKINDLAFTSFFNATLKNAEGACEKAIDILNEELNAKGKIYLRLGLTREFERWCWLQVNGIHAFPDFYNRQYEKWICLE